MAKQNIHTVAGVLKRALGNMDPCLVPATTFDQLIKSLELAPLQVPKGGGEGAPIARCGASAQHNHGTHAHA